MKPRHKRITIAVAGVAAVGVIVALVLNAFQSNLVFFYSPTQVVAKEAPQGRTFRVGGLVKEGTGTFTLAAPVYASLGGTTVTAFAMNLAITTPVTFNVYMTFWVDTEASPRHRLKKYPSAGVATRVTIWPGTWHVAFGSSVTDPAAGSAPISSTCPPPNDSAAAAPIGDCETS